MITHRKLDGSYAICEKPETCELRFHFPDLIVAELEVLPETLLQPLLEIMDPPSDTNTEGWKVWWDETGLPHRDYDLPAVVWDSGGRLWSQHGSTHRDGDKPAFIYANGDREWYRRGLVHRDGDQPAMITAEGDQRWYQDGMRHRGGGLPAEVDTDGSCRWWVNDEQVNPEEGNESRSFPTDAHKMQDVLMLFFGRQS